jgi:hypothetical protein
MVLSRKTGKKIRKAAIMRAAIIGAHKHSSHHKAELARVRRCGCFSCCRIFATAKLKEWTDGGDTAVCPFCGIDAILPAGMLTCTRNTSAMVNAGFLDAMHRHWFADTRATGMKDWKPDNK